MSDFGAFAMPGRLGAWRLRCSWIEIYKQHLTGPGHPERPERYDAVMQDWSARACSGCDANRAPPRQ